MTYRWVGGWVGGWVGVEKVEEEEAVRMRCWGLGMGGWMGGAYLPKEDFFGGAAGQRH